MVMSLSKEEEPKPHRISPPTVTELAPKKDTENPKSVSTGHGLFVSWERTLSQSWREGFPGVCTDLV